MKRAANPKPPKPSRPRQGETDAAFVGRMGWVAGTVIEGTNGYAEVARLTITAIGRRGILVVDEKYGWETGWRLDEREWIEVRPAPKQKAVAK